MKTHLRSNRYLGASPWTLPERLGMIAWEMAWAILCAWTPKPANRWRLLVLRAFGAKIHGLPFVHQRARIQVPWNIELGDKACVGDRTSLYSIDRIVLRERAVAAQEAYLCAGTHDFSNPALPLVTAPIEVGEGAFIGARAFIMPGVGIGPGAVVGACAVVTRNVAAGARVAGNPARVLPSG